MPSWAADELPELYQSCYCLPEYFVIYDLALAMSACVLTKPRHIVLFTVRGHTAVVMNKLFDIDLDSATRVVRSILRANRGVRRVRFDRMGLDFGAMTLPTRVLTTSCDMVLTLPSDVDEYLASLGRSTRQKLRSYTKHFRQTHSEHAFRWFDCDEIDDALVHRIIDMNRQRVSSKGGVSAYSAEEETVLEAFLREAGFATALFVGDEIVAGTLGTRAGRQCYLHVQSFDNAYAAEHLGWVSLFLTVSACIKEETDRLHLLWGRSEYKSRLGCVEECLCEACVYRSRLWHLLSVDDILRQLQWKWRDSTLSAARRSFQGSLGRRLRRSATWTHIRGRDSI